MKKVLCVALALVMVLGLSVTAMATPFRTNVTIDGSTIIIPVPGNTNFSAPDFDEMVPGNTFTFDTPAGAGIPALYDGASMTHADILADADLNNPARGQDVVYSGAITADGSWNEVVRVNPSLATQQLRFGSAAGANNILQLPGTGTVPATGGWVAEFDSSGGIQVRVTPGPATGTNRMPTNWNGTIYARWQTRAYETAPWVQGPWVPLSHVWITVDADGDDGAFVGTGVIPTNWRVYQYTGGLFGDIGEIYLPRMTGDAYNREIQFRPIDFQWQYRNAQGRWITVPASDLAGRLAGVDLEWPGAMRAVHFNNANASLVVGRTSGMDGTIRDVTLHHATGANANSAIRVRTPQFMTRVGNNDVAFDVSMRIVNRSFLLGRVVTVVGNDRTWVHSDNDWVAPTHQEYLRAEETLRNVEIYAGEGVTFTRNMTANVSIYVAAALWTDYAADELFQQHQELVDIIDIHHNGFNVAGVHAEIDRDNVYFVYNAQRQFIGTTAERLPFSTRYYLTTAQINLGGEVPNGEAPAEEPNGEVPDLGGDAGSGSTNVNHNPGTGR